MEVNLCFKHNINLSQSKCKKLNKPKKNLTENTISYEDFLSNSDYMEAFYKAFLFYKEKINYFQLVKHEICAPIFY